MDAISECEQLVRAEGGSEEDAPWQLHYRKEMFAPWHDVELDDVATDLIYRQIIQAVHANEYTLRSVCHTSCCGGISSVGIDLKELGGGQLPRCSNFAQD